MQPDVCAEIVARSSTSLIPASANTAANFERLVSSQLSVDHNTVRVHTSSTNNLKPLA